MKKIIFQVFITSIFLLSACNDGGTENESTASDRGKDSASQSLSLESKETKRVAVTFRIVEAPLAASIKEIVNHYLHIKNALANDKDSEAARAAESILKAMNNLDKSLLTAEQKSAYDNSETKMKKLADLIAKRAGKLEEQRIGFAALSESMYGIVKNFGGGQLLYHDHCPMAMEDRGAMWFSETKEIRNPYFGAKMFKCGTVEEIIP